MTSQIKSAASDYLTIPNIVQPYKDALDGSIDWITRSIKHGRGGSCAYYGVWGSWSKPYPETTGYIIPTLIAYSDFADDTSFIDMAKDLGLWLLSIQSDQGYWNGGIHPPKCENPSIFNTAQILLGLVALHRRCPTEADWIGAASRGARWLAQGVNESGVWADGNYMGGFNPSYYTRVAWPMLEVWHENQDAYVRDAAERVLEEISSRTQENGVVDGWGFKPNAPAFTHTIAYTIRGSIESARLLGDTSRYKVMGAKALETLYLKSELNRGVLPGAFDNSWKASGSFVCLTGNAQTAICMLKIHEIKPDLRLLNAATKLLDYICSKQRLRHPFGGIRGGVAGSSPLWGPYLRMRYPNWAAKFFADALMMCCEALEREQN